MGRYYTGDIRGKFMFAVQGSNAAESFGAFELERQVINYCILRGSYGHVRNKLKHIESTGCLEKIDEMFEKQGGYNNDILKKYGVSKKDLKNYADYDMGKKIKKFFDDNPGASELRFDAEC